MINLIENNNNEIIFKTKIIKYLYQKNLHSGFLRFAQRQQRNRIAGSL